MSNNNYDNLRNFFYFENVNSSYIKLNYANLRKNDQKYCLFIIFILLFNEVAPAFDLLYNYIS